jgi:hypothetical protein
VYFCGKNDTTRVLFGKICRFLRLTSGPEPGVCDRTVPGFPVSRHGVLAEQCAETLWMPVPSQGMPSPRRMDFCPSTTRAIRPALRTPLCCCLCGTIVSVTIGRTTVLSLFRQYPGRGGSGWKCLTLDVTDPRQQARLFQRSRLIQRTSHSIAGICSNNRKSHSLDSQNSRFCNPNPVGCFSAVGSESNGHPVTRKKTTDSQYRPLNIVCWNYVFLIANRHRSVYAVYPIEFWP